MTRISTLAEAELRETVSRTDILWRERLRKMAGEARSSACLFATVGGTAITAASGSTLGKGDVTLQAVNTETDTLEDLTDAQGNAVVVTAYNMVEEASGTNTTVAVSYSYDHKGNGIFLYHAEAC